MMLDKSEICAIYIISHDWRYASGKMMVRVTGLHGLGHEAVEAGYVNIYYPYTLALYIMDIFIGLKEYQKPDFPWRTKNGVHGL